MDRNDPDEGRTNDTLHPLRSQMVCALVALIVGDVAVVNGSDSTLNRAQRLNTLLAA